VIGEVEIRPGRATLAGARHADTLRCGDTAACALGAAVSSSPAWSSTPRHGRRACWVASIFFVVDQENEALSRLRSVVPGIWAPAAYIAAAASPCAGSRSVYNLDAGQSPSPPVMAWYEQMMEAAAGIQPGADGDVLATPGGASAPPPPEISGAWIASPGATPSATSFRAGNRERAYRYALLLGES